MRLGSGFASAVAAALLAPVLIDAQESARKIEGGGISVAGWTRTWLL